MNHQIFIDPLLYASGLLGSWGIKQKKIPSLMELTFLIWGETDSKQ